MLSFIQFLPKNDLTPDWNTSLSNLSEKYRQFYTASFIIMNNSWKYFASLILLGFASVVNAGWENFLCGKDPKLVFSPCNLDCQFNHGRTGGVCGDMDKGDFNCYCNAELSATISDKSINCNKVGDDLRNICTMDCICNHAAFGGYCDFERKACNCMGSGFNKQNTNCPTKTVREFADVSYNYLGPDVLGPYGVAFVNKAKERFPE